MAFLDKILLVVALAVTGVSVALFWPSVNPPAPPSVRAGGLTGDDYVSLRPASLVESSVEWPEPTPAVAGDLNSVYQVFTPPQIFWDRQKRQFAFTGVAPLPEAEPFGLALRAIEQEFYRIQFQAAIRAEDGSTLLQFFLVERNLSLQGAPGDKFPEHGFEIRTYELRLVIGEDGTARRVPTAEVYDERIDRVVELNTASRLVLEGEFRVVLETMPPNQTQTVVWDGVPGESVTDLESQRRYTLVSFSPTSREVTVRKEFLDVVDREPELVTLRPVAVSRAAPAGARAAAGAASAAGPRPAGADGVNQPQATPAQPSSADEFLNLLR